MITKFIGMKDFRQNLSAYAKKAQKDDIRFIVLRKNVPVFEVIPIDEKDFALEKIKKELDEAEGEYENGNYYKHEEVMKMFGLK